MVAVVVELIVIKCRLVVPLIKVSVTERCRMICRVFCLLVFGQARSEQEPGMVHLVQVQFLLHAYTYLSTYFRYRGGGPAPDPPPRPKTGPN